MLPVKPEILQKIDPCKTATSHISRDGASIETPFAQRVGFKKGPRFLGTFHTLNVKVERVRPQLP
jgi:hypothetical protein